MAIYIPSKNKIIYCIPKCASHYLWEVAKELDSASFWMRFNGITKRHPTPNQIFSRSRIAQIRRPLGIAFTRTSRSWLESYWRYHSKIKWKNFELYDDANVSIAHPLRPLDMYCELNLAEFISKINLIFPNFVANLYASYSHSTVEIFDIHDMNKELKRFLNITTIPDIPREKWNITKNYVRMY